eukprot:3409708-Rhodomonas_salina.1
MTVYLESRSDLRESRTRMCSNWHRTGRMSVPGEEALETAPYNTCQIQTAQRDCVEASYVSTGLSVLDVG